MLAFERSSYRLFPLPPVYNFRRFVFSGLYNIQGPAVPVVVRTSMFSLNASSVLIPVYKRAAATAAVQYMNDILQYVRYNVSSPIRTFSNFSY